MLVLSLFQKIGGNAPSGCATGSLLVRLSFHRSFVLFFPVAWSVPPTSLTGGWGGGGGGGTQYSPEGRTPDGFQQYSRKGRYLRQ